MQLSELKNLLPDKLTQLSSSTCLEVEENYGYFLLNSFLSKAKLIPTSHMMESSRGKIEVPDIQKTKDFGAPNYLITSGDYAGFICCSRTHEMRRVLMMAPHSDNRYRINQLKREFEKLGLITEDQGYKNWYIPALIATLKTVIGDAFEEQIFMENITAYNTYLSTNIPRFSS